MHANEAIITLSNGLLRETFDKIYCRPNLISENQIVNANRNYLELLKLRFGLLVAAVLVWVVLQRQQLVLGLNLLLLRNDEMKSMSIISSALSG